MLLPLRVLVILIITTTTFANDKLQCVYTQNYWRQFHTLSEEAGRNIAWPKLDPTNQNIPTELLTVCNVRWIDIMHIDTIKMIDKRNIEWVNAFHQLCASKLNEARIMNNGGNVDMITLSTKSNMDFLSDTLERYCDNMRDFYTDQDESDIIHKVISDLYSFNTGIKSIGSCTDEVHFIKDTEPFRYLNGTTTTNDTLPFWVYNTTPSGTLVITIMFIMLIGAMLVLFTVLFIFYRRLYGSKYEVVETRYGGEQLNTSIEEIQLTGNASTDSSGSIGI